MRSNEIVLFESRDGAVTLPVPVRDETVWLPRMQMADLFGVTPQNITIHLRNVYSSGELDRASTSKDFLLVQTEAGRFWVGTYYDERKGNNGKPLGLVCEQIAGNIVSFEPKVQGFEPKVQGGGEGCRERSL